MDARAPALYRAAMMYADRREAGRELAALLADYAGRKDVIVLGLPRGGVPVAKEVADRLDAPLDVLVVRKLGVPWQPELAAGAIASGGVVVWNAELQAELEGLNPMLEPVIARERAELQRREALYRTGRPPLEVHNLIAIIVDDGIATGATMEAAVLALRAMHARSVVIAVPVAPVHAVQRLRQLADRMICVQQPAGFFAVGQWYERFPQISDAEVRSLLTSDVTAEA